MTVQGLGIDLVSISEFTAQLALPGSRFRECFTAGERRDSGTGIGAEGRHLAARWAAKEAVIKAWSVSRYAQAPALSAAEPGDIEVVSDVWGRPAIRLHGAIAAHLRECVIHVSLTHDGDTAAAVAIIEAAQQVPRDA